MLARAAPGRVNPRRASCDVSSLDLTPVKSRGFFMAPFSRLRFSAYARDLERAILQLSREQRMGIASLRESLKSFPGASSLTMNYKDGGRTEVYAMGETSIEVPAGASDTEVADAFKKKLQSSPTHSIKRLAVP